MLQPPKTAHDEFKRAYKASFSHITGQRKSSPWDQKSTNRHFRAGIEALVMDLHRHVDGEKYDIDSQRFENKYKLNEKVMHQAWLNHARENRMNSRSPVTKGVCDETGSDLDALEEMVYDVSRQAMRAELAACGLLKALDESPAVDASGLIQEAEKLRDVKQVRVDGLSDAL